MQSVQLKMNLIELENSYRQQFSSFVDAFKIAAAKTDCMTHSKIKPIIKSMDEVLLDSDGLQVAFEKRGSSYQSSDAVYEQINSHRLRCADGLYTYCAQLKDIYILLQESRDKMVGNALQEALLPVNYVYELLNVFEVVKKELTDNRHLVEGFSCNVLIEQLIRELERIRKVIKSLHNDSLLAELRELATKHNRGQVDENSDLPQQPVLDLELTGKLPASEMQPLTLANQEKSTTNKYLESSDSESCKIAADGHTRVRVTRSTHLPLASRESKKQVRNQVHSLTSKPSDIKDEWFLRQRRLEEDSSSESDNERTGGDFPGSTGVNSIRGNTSSVEVGVVPRKTSSLSKNKANQTKTLLRSSMRRAPLYQKYQKFESEAAESSSMTPPSVEYDEMSKMKENNVDVASPESGRMMGDVFQDNLVDDVFDSDEDTSDYVCMNGTDFKKHKQNLREVECSNELVPLPRYSSDISDSDYVPMKYPDYENMVMTPASQEKSERCQLTKQDQSQTMSADVEVLQNPPRIIRQGSFRQLTSWCQIPLVRDSGVLEKMTSKQKSLQEAKYEFISSKVSYLKSLCIVQSLFGANEDLRKLMTPTEWNDLFQYIGPIKQCSEKFLSDLLSEWPQDIFLANQLAVVRQFADTGLQVYVDFCSHKITMDNTLKNIRANNPTVNKALKKLELEEICDGHDLESFLLLPIQRITRYPLLVEGILLRMDSNTDKDFCDWAKTYHKLRMIAKRCNDAVQDAETRKMS